MAFRHMSLVYLQDPGRSLEFAVSIQLVILFCRSVGGQIGQKLNTLWNDLIRVCIADSNTPRYYAYRTVIFGAMVSRNVIHYVMRFFSKIL